MTEVKSKLGITKFFTAYFRNFSKLIFTNVLFAVPALVFSSLCYTLGKALGFLNIITLSVSVIPLMPFFAGVTLVTRNMVRGDENVPVFSTFIRGIKENWLRFLVHGVVMYAAIMMSYFSIVLYYNLANQNSMFYAIMVLCIIISIIFVFTFFNLPLMTVTFDISMKAIYKNCVLMSLGELKSNFLAALGVFLLGIFCLSFLILSGSSLWVVILTLLFGLFLVPSSMSFIINYAEYKGMMTLLLSKEQKKAELEKEIMYQKNPALKKQEEARKFRDDFADVIIDDNGNDDEYIFHNGKMVKRSVLIKQMKAAGEVIDKKEEK
ncbi:MAG: DUF624 domain-containing protein [Oscillospiraceae bacterium]|nr:DUF624 domain-containing protein [Oscillospiraceae bacterium]